MGRGKPTKKSGSRPRKKKGDDGNDDQGKKRLFLQDRSVYQIHPSNYSPDHRELKEIVDSEVKSPPPNHLKRRASIQNIVVLQPMKRIEQDDLDEHLKLVQEVEARKSKKLEWRAQYN